MGFKRETYLDVEGLVKFLTTEINEYRGSVNGFIFCREQKNRGLYSARRVYLFGKLKAMDEVYVDYGDFDLNKQLKNARDSLINRMPDFKVKSKNGNNGELIVEIKKRTRKFFPVLYSSALNFIDDVKIGDVISPKQKLKVMLKYPEISDVTNEKVLDIAGENYVNGLFKKTFINAKRISSLNKKL
jgi:hypothetical protein